MKNKLKVGLFTDSFFPMMDGVIMVVDNYARLMKDVEITVFVPHMQKDFDDSTLPYEVVRCKSVKLSFIDYSLPLPKFDRKFMKEVEKHDFDLIHIHSPFYTGRVGLKLAKKRNIPVIATIHSQFYQDFLRAVKSKIFARLLTLNLVRVFSKCDECWAVNKEIKRIYEEEFGCKSPIKVMLNGADTLPLKDKKYAKEFINKKYNIDKETKVFLFVGRINKLKNVFFIVDSLKLLKEKSNMKFKMLFVGTGQDEEELIKHIKEIHMTNEITMCGKITNREELKMHYVRADLFLFPSLYDANSLVQIEAASQETPTLFIEGAVTSQTVTNNVNGFTAKNDVEAYTERIVEIMSNQKFLDEVSKNAKRDIYRSWETAAEEARENYIRLIDEKE